MEHEKLATAYIVDQPFTGVKTMNAALSAGSSFENLYQPYLEEPFKVDIGETPMQRAMRRIQALSLLVLDLGLYLDTHRDDEEAFKVFRRNNQLLKEETAAFEKTFFPLTVDSVYNDELPYEWAGDDWPWELGN